MKTKDLSQLAIDAVLCISLNSREDRRNALLESFRDSGLKIDFFLVDKDTDNPERGCFDSHRAVAKKILDSGWKHVLVLEDDCMLDSFSPKLVVRINRFLRDQNPEIFYLGVLLGKCWLTWNISIARCQACGTHAYIISDQGCRKMLAWENYTAGQPPIDVLFAERFKGYCAFPMIAFQNEAFTSDIETKRAERSRESEGLRANNIYSPSPPTKPGLSSYKCCLHALSEKINSFKRQKRTRKKESVYSRTRLIRKQYSCARKYWYRTLLRL